MARVVYCGKKSFVTSRRRNAHDRRPEQQEWLSFIQYTQYSHLRSKTVIRTNLKTKIPIPSHSILGSISKKGQDSNNQQLSCFLQWMLNIRYLALELSESANVQP